MKFADAATAESIFCLDPETSKGWKKPYRCYADERAHQRVAAIDPLPQSRLLREVPVLNRRADVAGLVALTRRLLGEQPRFSEGWGFAEATAAMRDVGILLGSIRRHGEEPVEWMPQLEPWLLRIGRMTDLPPRDTLLHYTIWNPDHALRTYTDLAEEAHLIQAVKIAFPSLERAIVRLAALFDLRIDSPSFARTGEEILDLIAKVRDAAVYTYRHVDRQVFVTAIRPYFEPITVAGRSHLGPGAVAMPLFVFEHLLWSARVDDAAYVGFKRDYLPVTLPYLRVLYDKHLREGALLDHLEPQLDDERIARDPQTRASVAVLHRIFRLINGFRAVHLRMAQQAYERGHSAFERGSGGYAPDILVHIQNLSQQAQKRLASCLWAREASLVPA